LQVIGEGRQCDDLTLVGHAAVLPHPLVGHHLVELGAVHRVSLHRGTAQLLYGPVVEQPGRLDLSGWDKFFEFDPHWGLSVLTVGKATVARPARSLSMRPVVGSRFRHDFSHVSRSARRERASASRITSGIRYRRLSMSVREVASSRVIRW